MEREDKQPKQCKQEYFFLPVGRAMDCGKTRTRGMHRHAGERISVKLSYNTVSSTQNIVTAKRFQTGETCFLLTYSKNRTRLLKKAWYKSLSRRGLGPLEIAGHSFLRSDLHTLWAKLGGMLPIHAETFASKSRITMSVGSSTCLTRVTYKLGSNWELFFGTH